MMHLHQGPHLFSSLHFKFTVTPGRVYPQTRPFEFAEYVFHTQESLTQSTVSKTSFTLFFILKYEVTGDCKKNTNTIVLTASFQFTYVSLCGFEANRFSAGRVVSMLDSVAEGPGFELKPRRCRATVLGKLFTPIVPLVTKQRNW